MMRPIENMLKCACITLGLGLAACSGGASEEADPLAESASETTSISVQDVTSEEASALLGELTSIVVLDVRTPEEFAAGHIEGAINISVTGDNFLGELAALDRGATYLVHCKSGSRSARALELMRADDFQNIVHMTDGFDGWTASGLPVQQ